MIKPSCVYCGRVDASDHDHVPPLCLFPKPPADAITVPSCRQCNVNHGRDDERVRNLLTSLASTESHPAVLGHVAARRDRSLERDVNQRRGKHVEHLLDSLTPVEIRTPGGLHVGRSEAFCGTTMESLRRSARSSGESLPRCLIWPACHQCERPFSRRPAGAARSAVMYFATPDISGLAVPPRCGSSASTKVSSSLHAAGFV